MDEVLKGRVAIDATRQYRRVLNRKIATGIDKVDLAYIKEYQKQSSALLRLKKRWYILNRIDSATLFETILQDRPLSRKQLILFCANAYLTPRYKCPQILINTSHSGLEQASYSTHARHLFRRVAYFLHDTIPLEYPEYCKEGEDIKHIQRVKTILESGHLVITNSQDTLDKFSYFSKNKFHALGHKLEGTVSFLGTQTLDHFSTTPVAQQNLHRYFVVLGTIEPRKNHLLLLLVWRRLSEILKENCPKLYIVGKRGWDVEQVIDILERAPYAQKNIIEISNACDKQVTEILKNSSALLFPSFVEGFGLPLVQALQLSTPVIASDLAVFKELAGDIPDYADPIDVMQWLEIIINYSSDDSSMRAAQLKRLSNFRAFSWEEHFKIVTPQLNHLFIS